MAVTQSAAAEQGCSLDPDSYCRGGDGEPGEARAGAGGGAVSCERWRCEQIQHKVETATTYLQFVHTRSFIVDSTVLLVSFDFDLKL